MGQLLQLQGLGHLQRQPFAAGKLQLQPPGLQPVAPVARPGIRRRLTAGAIEGITKQGCPEGGAVDADLVGAAAGDRHLHQVGPGTALQQGEGAAGGQIALLAAIGGAPDATQLGVRAATDRHRDRERLPRPQRQHPGHKQGPVKLAASS